MVPAEPFPPETVARCGAAAPMVLRPPSMAATEHVADRLFFDTAEGRAFGTDDVPTVPPVVACSGGAGEPVTAP